MEGPILVIVAGFIVIFGLIFSYIWDSLLPHLKYKRLDIGPGDLVRVSYRDYPLLVLAKDERCHYYESLEIIYGYLCLDTIKEEQVFCACDAVTKIII